MKYLESYKFLWRSPNWGMNLLLCAIAPIVPIAGAMVVLGYSFDIIEALHRDGDRDYPDFDMNRLVPYLQRGVWPFLVQLTVTLPLVLLFFVLYIAFYIGLIVSVVPAQGSTQGGPTWLTGVVLLLGACALLFFIALELAVGLCLVPMVLRSGLKGDYVSGFSWPFIKDYLRRMWGTTLLSELFLGLTGAVLIMAGEMMCFVGIFPAQALFHFAQTYMLFQLYEEYLRRGGEAILPHKTVSDDPYPVLEMAGPEGIQAPTTDYKGPPMGNTP